MEEILERKLTMHDFAYPILVYILHLFNNQEITKQELKESLIKKQTN
jgi:hypothetical protein